MSVRVSGAVAFVGDVFKVCAVALAGVLGDHTVDVVIGHVEGFGLGDDIAEAGVGHGVGTTVFNGDGDLTADFGKDLGALGVAGFFLMLYVVPFGVTGHLYDPF